MKYVFYCFLLLVTVTPVFAGQPDDDPYNVLVIMTEGIGDHNESAALGSRIAGVVHAGMRGTS